MHILLYSTVTAFFTAEMESIVTFYSDTTQAFHLPACLQPVAIAKIQAWTRLFSLLAKSNRLLDRPRDFLLQSVERLVWR
jgi:hypothetical protein